MARVFKTAAPRNLCATISRGKLHPLGSSIFSVIGLVLAFSGAPSARAADCTPTPFGLVSWWRGEGNADDSAGSNRGIMQGGANANSYGFVGRGFSFDGTSGSVQIPDSLTLHLSQFTLETWVRFDSLDSATSGGAPAGDQYLVFKQNTRSNNFEGLDLSKTRRPSGDFIRFQITSAAGQAVPILSSTPVTTGQWYHVVAIRAASILLLYINGQFESATNFNFAPDYGTLPLYFGTSGQAYWDAKLKGALDEVSLYNRVLTASEVTALYEAGAAGKCPPASAAAITAQPQSQSVPEGTNAMLSVVAVGTPPLSYQWLRNGQPLNDGPGVSGAFGSTLTLSHSDTNATGQYTVVVTNFVGGVTSAVATVTVISPMVTYPWETAPIGVVWSDNFDRAFLDTNWVILGGANASIVNNELFLAQTNLDGSRQVYYQPWLTSSDEWTLRWSQRFGTLDATSLGVGVGLKNFQAQGGSDRGYNALLVGAGTNLGSIQIERWTGTTQAVATTGSAITLAAGDIVDCWFTRSGWTLTATASNRANAQVSTTTVTFTTTGPMFAPTISRICCYPLGGTVYLDNISFALNHRQPARFVLIGASMAEGYNASAFPRGYVRMIGSNFSEAVANISSSYNGTSNAVSLLPEILAYHPDTAILMVGGNDLLYGYPSNQWQVQYATLAAQLRSAGVKVKHGLPPPRTPTDLTALRNWILTTYDPADIIDTWTPLQSGAHSLNPTYDSGDGVHPNDAGHMLLSQIIVSNLPPGIRTQPNSVSVGIGANVGLSMNATGGGTLAYQWLFNGDGLADNGRLSGCASNLLAVRNAQTNDSGVYQVVVANSAGAVTSSPALLKVVQQPVLGAVFNPDGSALVSWSSVAGQSYTLQYKDDLYSPWWSNLMPSAMIASGTNTSLAVPMGSASQRFFRISFAP